MHLPNNPPFCPKISVSILERKTRRCHIYKSVPVFSPKICERHMAKKSKYGETGMHLTQEPLSPRISLGEYLQTSEIYLETKEIDFTVILLPFVVSRSLASSYKLHSHHHCFIHSLPLSCVFSPFLIFASL
jgi:hypothetical protein